MNDKIRRLNAMEPTGCAECGAALTPEHIQTHSSKSTNRDTPMNATVEKIAQDFLQDVAKHEMTIIRNDGIDRHIRFQKPDTSNMYFDLITWKGHLCYTGDMGTYVFARIEDMFAFFRHDPRDDGPHINPSYWSEKVLAQDRCEPVRIFDESMFMQRVRDRLDGIGAGLTLRAEVQDTLISRDYASTYEALQAIRDFQCDGENPFEDAWEWNIENYSFRFLWACYAIVWGIGQFDKKIKPAVNATEAV